MNCSSKQSGLDVKKANVYCLKILLADTLPKTKPGSEEWTSSLPSFGQSWPEDP